MIAQTDFIKKIKDFGLNSYEAKIWTALLSRGISSAGELSEISNVPRSRTYDVLESLEKKGFIMMKLGKPIKYMAIPPSEVIERVKKKVREESSRQEKVIEELKGSQILAELTTLHTQGIDIIEPNELAGLLKNRDNLYNHLDLMMRNATQSIYIITSEDGLLRKFDSMKKTFKKASDKGVKIKVIAPMNKDSEKVLAELRNFAESLRTQIKSGIVAVGTEADEKASIVVMVTKDLTSMFDAREIIKDVVVLVDGRGGGRADMAQAGGKRPEGLKEALNKVVDVVGAMAKGRKVS